MAQKIESYETPNIWEILASFFGYFAVAKDVPNIFRTLHLPSLFPDCIKKKMLEWVPDSNFWLLLSFTIPILLFLLYFLFKKEPREPPEKPDEEIRIEKISKILRRGRVIRVIRTFGLVLVREFILDRLGITIYGTFTRPEEWPEQATHFDFIDRIRFKSRDGIEFQYRRNYLYLTIRKHPGDNFEYGPPEDVPLKWEYLKILMVASNFFPFWLFVYLLKRPLVWSRTKS
jgi:hypothetical protein